MPTAGAAGGGNFGWQYLGVCAYTEGLNMTVIAPIQGPGSEILDQSGGIAP
jgi:hypothetical protein